VEHDPEHRGRHAAKMQQRVDAQRTQRRERRGFLRLARLLREHVHRARRALAHRGEQVGLVAEMPVDRAPRQARLGRDLGKRGPRDAMVAEHALGSVEQLLAGGSGLYAGAADHREGWTDVKKGCKRS
jgi:hypothetical protein